MTIRYSNYTIWMPFVEFMMFVALTAMIITEVFSDSADGPDLLSVVHVMPPLGWVIFFSVITATDLIIMAYHLVVSHREKKRRSKIDHGHKSGKKVLTDKLLTKHISKYEEVYNTELVIFHTVIPRFLFYVIILSVYIAGTPIGRFYEYL